MITRKYSVRGNFNFRCLFGHKFGEWVTRTRHYPLPSLETYIWSQRKCERCGKQEGTKDD